jgi:hypothetical protein
MKKIADIVTSTENTETSISKSRGKVSFGSFKRAEDKELKKIKDLEEQEQLTRIAEDAVYADKIRAQKAASIRMVRERETELARKTREIEEKLVEEEKRVIKAEAKRKRDEFITSSLKNAFGTKNEVNMTPVREEVIDKYLPQLKEIEKKDYPEPFKEEPALNAELAEFKKKINEHLHTIGFASSGGGGIGSIADANDIEDLDDGEFIQYRASDGKFIGATASVSNLALTALDIDGGTDIGAAIADADLFVVDDAAGGTNRKAAASRIKTYIADVTLTTAAQTNITSVGTLTTLTVDNIIINGTNIGHTSDTDAIAIASDGVVTFSQVPLFPNNTVETADIQDNAITLAKLAGGTDGNIISFDASGDPVAIATGNDGQVLTSTGAGSPPAFEDAADLVGPASSTNNSLAKFDGTTGKLLKDGAVIGTDVQAYNADTLFADVADNLTVGFSTTVHDAGTKSSGTYTPDQDDGNIQKAVNGGAHTLAPTTDDCAVIIQYTNNASAGTITTSGFTLVDGDTITTTNGHDFFFYLTKANGFSLLTVKALQ